MVERLLYGWRISAGMIADQWASFTVQIQKESKVLLELANSKELSVTERRQLLEDFSARVQRSADFMASLCQMLLPAHVVRPCDPQEGGEK
ncbi:MAG: hypothetical protein E7029_10025 [Planctomycetaceae bacterium]|nr:hypothetical protein [Planctomycetaceae bacterium]